MERRGYLQLAAEGPLRLQGGLHGEWPWAEGHCLQEAHSACRGRAGPHGSCLLCIWPTFDTHQSPNSCLWSCSSQLLAFSQRTLPLRFLLESCAWPHTISSCLFNLMNVQGPPFRFLENRWTDCLCLVCVALLQFRATTRFNRLL